MTILETAVEAARMDKFIEEFITFDTICGKSNFTDTIENIKLFQAYTISKQKR